MKKWGPWLFLGILFCGLNVDVWWPGADVSLIRDLDEAFYGLLVKDIAVHGCRGVPVVYQFPEAINFHSCGFLRILNFLVPFGSLFTRLIGIILLSRIFLAACLGFFTHLIFRRAWWGVAIALALGLDGGIFVFKPGIMTALDLLHGNLDPFSRFNRLISPQQYMSLCLPWVLIFAAWLWCDRNRLLNSRRISLFAGAAILLGGIVVQTPYYSFAPLFGAVGWVVVMGFILKAGRNWWLATGIYALTVVAALLSSLAKLKIPFVDEVMPRSGFFVNDYQPLFVFDKGLILGWILIGVLVFWAFRNRPRWWIPALPFSFYLLMNFNLLTGREYQNFHFKDGIASLWFITLILLLRFLFPRKEKWLAMALGLLLVVGLTQHLRSQLLFPGYFHAETLRPDLTELVSALEHRPQITDLECGDFNDILPLLVSARCGWHHFLMLYPLSNDTVLDMTQAHERLRGVSDAEVLHDLEVIANDQRSVADWDYGQRSEWIQGVDPVVAFGLPYLKEKIIPLWMESYRQVTVDQALAVIKPQMLVLSKAFAQEHADRFEPVEVFRTYGLYQIRGSIKD